MRHPLVLPDLGLGTRPVTLSLWLVRVGDEVTEGDRVVEVLADGVTIDLPAPASGVLVEMLVDEEESLDMGQVLGTIESADT